MDQFLHLPTDFSEMPAYNIMIKTCLLPGIELMFWHKVRWNSKAVFELNYCSWIFLIKLAYLKK